MAPMLSRKSWLSIFLIPAGLFSSLSITSSLALNENYLIKNDPVDSPHTSAAYESGGADGGGIGVGDMEVESLKELSQRSELSCQDTYACLVQEY
jgi:hypothetical protein